MWGLFKERAEIVSNNNHYVKPFQATRSIPSFSILFLLFGLAYITSEFRTFYLWIWIHNIKLRCLTSLEPHFIFSCTCRCNDAAPPRGFELRTFYPWIRILNQNTKPRRCLTSNPCRWNVIYFFLYMKV